MEDLEMQSLLHLEETRQRSSLELIASENFTSAAVLKVLGSVFTNKYSEGRPGRRYYGGNEVIDKMELLCEMRAREAFDLKAEEWEVNCQALSGSPANLAVYLALLKPGDKIMGLKLSSGGHLSHGYSTPSNPRLTAPAAFYETSCYEVDPETHEITREGLRAAIEKERPTLVIAGASSYPRFVDWIMFRELCDDYGCILMVDMAHISGLIAGKVHPSPFPYADVVTTTTHKTLRGPRGALIFMNKVRLGFERAMSVHQGVFPGIQGGPHNNAIAAVCTQLKEVCSPQWKSYTEMVVSNCKVFVQEMKSRGFVMTTGGSDNHLCVIDTKKTHGITGSKAELVCDAVGITLNRNTVPGDTSPLSPSGIRIGTPAMTTRECGNEEWRKIAELVDKALLLTIRIQEETETKKLADFKEALERMSGDWVGALESLKREVNDFAMSLPFPTD